jgi:hypothetical protein
MTQAVTMVTQLLHLQPKGPAVLDEIARDCGIFENMSHYFELAPPPPAPPLPAPRRATCAEMPP